MRSPIRRSALAATSLLLAGGLALGACGGGKSSSANATDLLTTALQAQVNGDVTTAKSQFEAVLKADPTDQQASLAHYNLGQIAQTAERNNATAKSEYEAALKIDPTLTAALYNLAIVETANGNKTEAIDLYKRAVASNPADANSNLNLGFLLYETGDKSGADSAFRKAIALNPALRTRIPADQQPTD